MDRQVDAWLSRGDKWRDELEQLRSMILDCGLTEQLKWGVPCYTYLKRNVVIICRLKESCVLSFFKGVLLDDTDGILSKPGENTQAVRLIRFSEVREIVRLEPVLKAYIYEAIEVEKAGLQVSLKKRPQPKIPEEFQQKMKENPALKAAFYELTPGRRRAYLLYFSDPRQSKTRMLRVEKCIRQILQGKGLNDEYFSRRK